MYESIYEFIFGVDGVYAIAPLAAGAIIGGGSKILGGIFGMIGAGKRRRRAEREQKRREQQIAYLENNRQAITNPYQGVVDSSDLIGNPYSNMGVATGAAEMQAQQVDQSLANMVDLMRSTGQGAGGATALARMAAESNQGISASIEAQERENQKLRAKGEAVQQQAALAEAQRVQASMAAGEQFMFSAQENREFQKLNRIAGLQEQAMAERANAQTMYDNSLGALLGGAGSFGSAAALGAFSKNQGV